MIYFTSWIDFKLTHRQCIHLILLFLLFFFFKLLIFLLLSYTLIISTSRQGKSTWFLPRFNSFLDKFEHRFIQDSNWLSQTSIYTLILEISIYLPIFKLCIKPTVVKSQLVEEHQNIKESKTFKKEYRTLIKTVTFILLSSKL